MLVRDVLGSLLGAGLALLAGAALADAPPGSRIQGDFVVQDDNYPGDVAVVEIDGTIHDVSGFVSGSGTAGDAVVVSFFTPAPNTLSANDKRGSVKQSRYSRLVFSITSPARNLDLTVTPEKCSVSGTTDVARGKGRVNVSCSGQDLFQAITADQLASIQAAFLGDKRVKLKVSASSGAKGSLSIQIKGASFPEQ